MRLIFALIGGLLLMSASAARADHSRAAGLILVQAHLGQMDTDGILSPGERPNPNIDYDKAQRHGLKHGDPRYDNPDNDALADADRDFKRDQEREERWERDRREAREHEWRDREERKRKEAQHEYDEHNSWNW